MNTKRKGRYNPEPYSLNDDVVVYYELDWNGTKIVPKTPIKFKLKRPTYFFRLMAHHVAKDVTWIDCYYDGQFHSFYIEELKGPVKPRKRSRAKKTNVK